MKKWYVLPLLLVVVSAFFFMGCDQSGNDDDYWIKDQKYVINGNGDTNDGKFTVSMGDLALVYTTTPADWEDDDYTYEFDGLTYSGEKVADKTGKLLKGSKFVTEVTKDTDYSWTFGARVNGLDLQEEYVFDAKWKKTEK